MLNITKTKEEIIKDKLIMIDYELELVVKNLENSTNNLTLAFFNDPEISGQDFADAIGTKAQELFALLNATQQFIKGIKPEYELPVMPEIKWKKDGTAEIVNNLVVEEVK